MVFDTNCVLCSGFVHFILRHEAYSAIIFVNAWSETGSRLAREAGLDPDDLRETFLVVTDGRGLTKSDASLALAAHLKRPWRWLTLFRFVPRPLRDGVYTIIARRRYKWFGYKEACMIVPADMKHRFIDV